MIWLIAAGRWIRDNALFAALMALALLAFGIGTYIVWTKGQTAKTEARLSKNQTGAAIESGKDAVETVGNSAAVEANSERQTRDSSEAIGKAEGANEKVAAPVRDAGLAALCKRRAYQDSPRCKTKP